MDKYMESYYRNKALDKLLLAADILLQQEARRIEKEQNERRLQELSELEKSVIIIKE